MCKIPGFHICSHNKRSQLGSCYSPMGNLIQRSGRKTHPSVPQENSNRDNIQGSSAILPLLANGLKVESSVNCRPCHHVDAGTRGKKKCTVFHCQVCPYPAMQGNVQCLLNIHEKPGCSNCETQLPEGQPQHLLRVWHHSAFNLLHECVRLQTFHAIPFFVHDGIDINETDKSGLTALHIASKTLRKNAIQMLLLCGANINLTDSKTGRSALHFAARASSSKGGVTLAAGEECIKLLLRNKADVRMQDRNGKEAIHFACRGGREDLVILLLNYGADINSLTNLQESPLFLFLENKSNLRQIQLLDKLLSLSYPLKITNSEDCLPTGLISPFAGRLRKALLKITSDVLPLQEICKFNIRKTYGEKMKLWLEAKLPVDLWKSIYIDQEFSYASKMKSFNSSVDTYSGSPR